MKREAFKCHAEISAILEGSEPPIGMPQHVNR
jgi:hypothetical protein